MYENHELNAAAIGHTFTMTNVFVCLEQTLGKELLLYTDLSEFPVQAFFLRECPEFDKSLKDSECLGGTLSFLEQEMKNKMTHLKSLKIDMTQSKMLKLVQLIIKMFNNGLLDHIGNY